METVRHSIIVSISFAIVISGGDCLARTKTESYCSAQDFKPAPANSDEVADESRPGFELSKINSEIIDQFRRAWKASSNGIRGVEVVVLILRNTSRSCIAIRQRPTNQHKKLTFAWNPNTVAVVHTHPNSCPPEPQDADIQIAERFGVPMFTLTIHGMYMYDPRTKKTTRIHDRLDWMELSKWVDTKNSS